MEKPCHDIYLKLNTTRLYAMYQKDIPFGEYIPRWIGIGYICFHFLIILSVLSAISLHIEQETNNQNIVHTLKTENGSTKE